MAGPVGEDPLGAEPEQGPAVPAERQAAHALAHPVAVAQAAEAVEDLAATLR